MFITCVISQYTQNRNFITTLKIPRWRRDSNSRPCLESPVPFAPILMGAQSLGTELGTVCLNKKIFYSSCLFVSHRKCLHFYYHPVLYLSHYQDVCLQLLWKLPVDKKFQALSISSRIRALSFLFRWRHR